MKMFKIAAFLMLVIIGGMLITLGTIYNVKIAPVSTDSKLILVKIPKGTSLSGISTILKEKELIKDEFFFNVYLKLNKVENVEAGSYKLSKNMGVKKIVAELLKGGISKIEMDITFKEGLNMRQIAQVIEEKTFNTEEDVFNLLKDEDYINSLIEKYWFLKDTIKNENIYYPLEGYLYPETYRIYEDATVKDIFNKILAHTDIILSKYKVKIENSKYSVHQILTLASIIEEEAKYKEDRPIVASVFYNRLNKKMVLGSDVTTYYAAKKDYTADLTASEIKMNSPYNTRNANMAGKLPIGPISNPSDYSIEAVINPKSTNYYYFVSDKNGKLYFSKDYTEHNKTITKLKNEGLWYEW